MDEYNLPCCLYRMCQFTQKANFPLYIPIKLFCKSSLLDKVVIYSTNLSVLLMLIFLYINFWLLKPRISKTRNYFMLSKHRKWGENILKYIARP